MTKHYIPKEGLEQQARALSAQQAAGFKSITNPHIFRRCSTKHDWWTEEQARRKGGEL